MLYDDIEKWGSYPPPPQEPQILPPLCLSIEGKLVAACTTQEAADAAYRLLASPPGYYQTR